MSEKKMTSIGGQAVIEGIMMRGPEKTAVAVRKPDGEIIIDENENKIKGGVRKIPLIRGVFSFIDSMTIGIKALMFSANFYDDDGKPKENEENKQEKKMDDNKNEEMPGWMMALTIASSLCISIGLFIALPNLIAGFIVPGGAEATGSNVVLYNVVESIVKITIFLVYLLLVSRMRDIQRVFEYHGAEHKTIFCYENGEELTVENVKKFQRFHPRCGTSFLLFVIIISIIVFSIIGRFDSKIVNMLVRIALLPVVAGISYEIIRFAGKHVDNKWVSWLNKPGMWLQRLTTREPDEKQIEVAITALKAVLPKDKNADNW
ncbi:MAG: DUF1385 domain-containing protein [Clostridia bacterium]|nr:DUF1385 domain-containing protein [Clostridia bacterium]